MQKKLLIETLSEFYRISGIKNYKVLAESKATEAHAANILRKANVENIEDVINQFKEIDEQSGKYIPVMAFFYANGETRMNNYREVFAQYLDLVNNNRIEPAMTSKQEGGVKMGNNVYTDFLSFAERVHAIGNNYGEIDSEQDWQADMELKGDYEKMGSYGGIDIYDGNDIGKCIQYTMGGLTGRTYSFCIGQPGNTMWQSYRDSKTSTFYYLVDTNREMDDPLHIVVFDQTAHGVELTDMNNNTENIAEYGSDPSGYIKYLESKGVPVEEMFVNKPKTPEEEEEDERFGNPNNSLKWFMGLNVKEKSRYIGRGHQLTDEQFDFLMGKL
jgi:hypothetical protein